MERFFCGLALIPGLLMKLLQRFLSGSNEHEYVFGSDLIFLTTQIPSAFTISYCKSVRRNLLKLKFYGCLRAVLRIILILSLQVMVIRDGLS